MRLIDLDKLLLQVKMRRYTKASLSLLYNQEVVDAIPITWIELFMKKYWHIGDSEFKVLDFMVTEWKKWEKENEGN